MQLSDFLKKQLEDAEFSKLWRESDPSFQAGALIVGLRSRLGLSQAELAERAGVKRPYIARIEAGEANPTVESLGKILSAVGHSLRLSSARQEDTEGDLSGSSMNIDDARKVILTLLTSDGKRDFLDHFEREFPQYRDVAEGLWTRYGEPALVG